MRKRFHTTILLAAIGLLPLFARAETLPEGWSHRRALAFKQAVSDAPGDNLAWAEFYADGSQLPDFADLRITTADRAVVPHKLLAGGKAHDFVRVAFATKSDGPYYAWWGNPKATKPAEDLKISRGVYLEVSRADGRAVQQLLGRGGGRGGGGAQAGEFLGGIFVPEFSIGYNPLGDERNCLLHYAAQFKIDRPIKPNFAFTSTDAGILLIDGNQVVQERGGLRSQVRAPVPVDLAAGWHTIEVRQASQGAGNTAMAVVWQRPGEQNYAPLPAAVIAPIARAMPGALERVGSGGAFVPDFSIEPSAEAFVPPAAYAQRYIFEAQFPAGMKPQISWDFGDGQVGKGLKRISHVFLAPGIYPVKLQLDVGTGAAPLATTIRLEVRERMYARFPRPPEDPPRSVQAVLKDYDPRKLSAEAALRGLLLFENSNDGEAMLAWGRAWLEMKDLGLPAGGGTENVVEEETFALARALEAKKDFAGAAEMYRLASAKPVRMETRLKLMWLGVAERADNVPDGAAAALTEAQGWAKQVDAIGAEGRIAFSAVAYAAIAAGDGKAAKAAVEAAERADAHAGGVSLRGGGGAGGGRFNQAQIRQGVLARNVENYIRTKDFDTAWGLINDWDMEFPTAAWEGFTRTLRVKLAAAEGRQETAARMALAHARANPDGFYAAELLYRASEHFAAGGRANEARTTLELLRSKYPESPYARESTPK
jgi:hypothetical protein